MADVSARRRDDAGAAMVEFLGVTVLVLVPVVYLVIAAAQFQAAAFAVEGASRSAARGAVVAGLDALESGGTAADAREAAVARAQAAVALALEDFSVRGEPSVTLECDSSPCFEPGSTVTAEVVVAVPLAGVPGPVVEVVPVAVDVSATGRSPVEGFSP
ncbi:pilus assembly protein [Demequina muriae]|uniref:Pilus assembly protein n=1 Tax=Demequina muriae TaxID=3051664 RepID=A0ABT8GF52_9MICO|nr:pilus assembly protein [Demequina sp. EGI L300058]MDN4479899.1 pilus assembly protein [Demequina sp. EGI L300058]